MKPVAKFITAITLSLGLVTSAFGVAYGDDLVADPATSAATPVELDAVTKATQDVTITLVAVDDDAAAGSGCNLVSARGHELEASVVSNDTAIVTVSPPVLTFTSCAQSRSFTITAEGPGTATVTIAPVPGWRAAGGPNAIFSSETVHVRVAGDTANSEITVCDGPAAPAWAAHILKTNGKPTKPADQANYISQVAKQMTPGATFGGVAKSNQAAYGEAVRAHLMTKLGPLSPPANWPANACTTT